MMCILENNNLNANDFGKGMADYAQVATSWNQYAEDNNLSPEQKQAGLDKLAKGDMPEGQDIAKAIIDGYVDGVLIAGVWYLGPAAGIGKVAAGSTIASIVNGTYQWYDLNQPGNENKTWDYKGSIGAAVTGGLAPGRGILANTGIAMGGSVFSDGPNVGAQLSSGAGAFLGGGFGELAPIALKPIFGNSSGFVGDVGGAFVSEVISNGMKNYKSSDDKKDEKK